MDSRIATILENHGISVSQTEAILRASDYGRRRHPDLDIKEFPDIDGKIVINARSADHVHSFPAAAQTLTDLGCSRTEADYLLALAVADSKHPEARVENDTLYATRKGLHSLGLFLVPLVSFGVLNGGSASSYFDDKKNKEFAPGLFETFADFVHGAKGDIPKGLTPAYFNPDGTSGQNFVALKLRAWLRIIVEYQKIARGTGIRLSWDGLEKRYPFFQMTSTATDGPLREVFSSLSNDPFIRHLLDESGISLGENIPTEVQDLVAAFTIGEQDGKRDVFLNAYGHIDKPIGLPAGHGQNFTVLGPVYRKLFATGKRLAYLGNVDNMGFFPDPASIAMTVLTKAQASFEFSFRTPMDHKGGVLVRGNNDRLCTADIGRSISREVVDGAENKGTHVLFNCATGLFDLSFLVPELERISHELPVRFSNQDKDAGKYSQAEQNTWEVLALLERPLVLAVEKQERFLAAKLFLDCLLTSGMGQEMAGKGILSEKEERILAEARELNKGLTHVLRVGCGLELKGGRWV